MCRTTCGRPDCGYEGCLAAAGDAGAVQQCQCNCFKSLPLFQDPLTTIVDYPNFPICKEKYCGCLDCFKLVGFERLVKKRRDECLRPTEAKVSGSFADCQYQGRLTPAFINQCKDTVKCNSTDPTNTTTAGRNVILNF